MSHATLKNQGFASASGPAPEPKTLDWLASPECPPVRYLTARCLIRPRPSQGTLRALRRQMLAWKPLQQVLSLQLDDGSFPYRQKTLTAQPTFIALCLMERCGLEVEDEPVARVLAYLTNSHIDKGALSYTSGGSGILPCYLGLVAAVIIRMGGLDTSVAQTSIQWLIDHQRFDHKGLRAGGRKKWPYKAVANYGCWDSVSCYHGVVGALQALAAIPPQRRSPAVKERLADAIEYLRIHRVYKRSSSERPLFRHMTQFFIVGDYRSNLLDVLEGLADANLNLIAEDWVQDAVRDVENLTPGGKISLVKNYGRKLIEPIPFEPVGKPSRFLTYQWWCVRQKFGM